MQAETIHAEYLISGLLFLLVPAFQVFLVYYRKKRHWHFPIPSK